jgi:hypothetical protein
MPIQNKKVALGDELGLFCDDKNHRVNNISGCWVYQRSLNFKVNQSKLTTVKSKYFPFFEQEYFRFCDIDLHEL